MLGRSTDSWEHRIIKPQRTHKKKKIETRHKGKVSVTPHHISPNRSCQVRPLDGRSSGGHEKTRRRRKMVMTVAQNEFGWGEGSLCDSTTSLFM
mmetsp:Transcript_25386/g.49593  ORF Transcript_25386/g.49593 Transcript_25386/m.49593 type:complete len:94 (-) Transcript_25386:653-934(-)